MGCGEKSLGDSAIKKALKDAVNFESLKERNDLYYQVNESEPFSGWVKLMYDSGQAERLGRFKDGKRDGPEVAWHENGQKQYERAFKDDKIDGPYTKCYENGQKIMEGTYKDGIPDGPNTKWHDNGQRKAEATYKDGAKISAKYWNSKGEEVETEAEAEK